ncbi:S26 family signal peptidase [Shouchella clausii]|uniref:S26 family signal peptidase n=1 Tax=Shouchella clausii TaxID=79880 RepID=UPI00311DB7FB
MIGLPGHTIRLEDDIIYINGEQIEEPYFEEAKAANSRPAYKEASRQEILRIASWRISCSFFELMIR